ncbi:MAG: ADP-ribosylglycohydrolase family protein [Gammaproteobacteria bacterium]
MASDNATRSLLRVVTPFEVDWHVWFRAPFSLSDTATLPAGVVLKLARRPELSEAVRNEASVRDAADWAPFLLSASMRFHPRFAYSYNTYLSDEQIERYCEPVADGAVDEPAPLRLHRALQGCLLGTAIGDALGLPFEGLSPRRLAKFRALPLRQRFFLGRGMISDDTEHTALVAQALLRSGGEPAAFARALGWCLRWWFLGLPAGIGLATLRACLKLLCGIPPEHSGVYSAGNGPAMRSALLGVWCGDDVTLLDALVDVNTRITHRDPKAVRGARIVAELARLNALGTPLGADDAMDALAPIIAADDELLGVLSAAVTSAARGDTAMAFCAAGGMTKGVGGYMYHTLPVVLHIVLRHADDFETAVSEAVACGGDTDTVAAIVGGIVGAGSGVAGIPAHWRENLRDWPRDQRFLGLLGEELARQRILGGVARDLSIDLVRAWLRNAFFMAWVLAHGLRRLLPPY